MAGELFPEVGVLESAREVKRPHLRGMSRENLKKS
jgi:hypothetical protein